MPSSTSLGYVNFLLSAESADWYVADEPGEVMFDTAQWPQGTARELVSLVFGSALLQVPDIEVEKWGEFSAVTGLHSPPAKKLGVWFARGMNEEKAREEYDFDTGIWSGATLEQGVWYQMTAPLIMPGTVGEVVPHDIDFAYTHDVPCKAGLTDRSCVELVIRAAPQADALKAFTAGWAREMKLPAGRKAHYWSATYMRIVTDPHTLMTQVSDVRNYWHTSAGGPGPDDVGSQSERVVMTSVY